MSENRLLFRSYSMNTEKYVLSIPLEKISKANPRMTFGIVPNGLEIKTTDGATEKFVVQDTKDWMNKILAAREARAFSAQVFLESTRL